MPYKFNPSLATPQVLKETLVGRQAEVLDILRKIEECAHGTSLRHFLVIGPRGIGKTHFLLIIYHTVTGGIRWNGEYADLKRFWVPVRFAEEEYRIATLAEFLARVLEEAGKELPGIGQLPPATSPSPFIAPTQADADTLLGLLLQARAAQDKRFLLLVDNFQEILERFTEEDQGRLRDILMSKDLFLVIGTAPTLFDQVAAYEEPFYNFFENIWLDELGAADSSELVYKWWRRECGGDPKDASEEIGPKMNALVHLTGGNPRLILSLYSVLSGKDILEVEQTFTALLDELTPYFQSRMRELPEQQARIMDTLALMKGPATPTQIAREANLEVGKVTSQLKRLERSGYVTVYRVRGQRKALYDVKERLFRLWRQMRGEAGRRYLSFLVTVIKVWYTEQELGEHFEKVLSDLRLALEQKREEQAREAIQHLWYIREASPPYLSAPTSLARLRGLIEVHDYDAARAETEALLRQAVESQDSSTLASAHLGKAYLCDKTGDTEGVVEAVRAYLQQIPDDGGAWYNLGNAYASQERYEEAVEAYRKAVDIKPGDHQAWYNLGHAYSDLGRYEEAVEAYRKALEMKPDKHEACNNLGTAYSDLGRYEEAVEAYRRALEMKPDKHEAWYNLGNAYASQERYKEAMEAFTKALEIKPDKHEAWNNLGTAYARQGRCEEAIEAFARAVDIKPEDEQAWYNLGTAYARQGRCEEAVEAYRRALEMKPDKHEAWNNLGTAYARQGRYEEAVQAFAKAIALAPSSARYHIGRAAALAQAGKFAKALQDAEGCYRLAEQAGEETLAEPASGVVVALAFASAETKALQGRTDLAEKYLKKALPYARRLPSDQLQERVAMFLNHLLQEKKADFLKEAIDVLEGAGLPDLDDFLRFYRTGLQYIESRDRALLSELPPELRELLESLD